MDDMEFRKWLVARFDRLEDKQDEQSARLDRYNASLDIHIAGVQAVNKRVDQGEQMVTTLKREIEPVLGVIKFGSLALKIFLGTGSLCGSIYGIVKLISALTGG